MTTKTIKKLNQITTDPSKTQEMDYLIEFANGIPSNSYLMNLVKPELLQWFEMEIKNDFTGDIWDHISGLRSDSQKAAQYALDQKNDIQTLKGELAEMTKIVDEKNVAIERLADTILDLQKQVSDWRSDNNEYYEANRELARKVEEVEARCQKYAAQNWEILNGEKERILDEMKS